MRVEQIVVRAAWVRVGLAAGALAVLPLRFPAMADDRPVFAVYLAWTLLAQALVSRNVGGTTRSFIAGVVDLAVLTFIVHRVGSTATILVSLYVLSGMMNALLVSLPVGLALAAIGSCFYTGVLVAEHGGWLDYAAAGPPWLHGHPPDTRQMIVAAALAAVVLVTSTWLVGMLVRSLKEREAELLAANAQLEEISVRDALTQIYNRRHLLARAGEQLARVRRGHPLTLVMIDLDGFKRINDRDGHQRGDALLKEIAAALTAAVRQTDVSGRYGGDEFCVLLTDTDASQAHIVADRLTRTVREVGLRFDDAHPVTASVGVAVAVPDDTVTSLLRRADENSYSAKRAGGNRVVMTA